MVEQLEELIEESVKLGGIDIYVTVTLREPDCEYTVLASFLLVEHIKTFSFNSVTVVRTTLGSYPSINRLTVESRLPTIAELYSYAMSLSLP